MKKINLKFKLNKYTKITLCVVLVIAVVLAAVLIKKRSDAKKAASENAAGVSIVTRGSVVNSITGSGTVEPIEKRDIVPLVNGKITHAPFEEGDTVKEGDILYQFEMTAAENAIKTAQNSVKSAENNVQKAKTNLENRNTNIKNIEEDIQNLTVYATESGRISDFNLIKGEEATGKICTITNYKEQSAVIPFNSAQIKNINVGDSATVAIEKYMINAKGSVVRKYTAPINADGVVLYNVEIKIDEDIYVSEGVEVTAVVHNSAGNISSASYGVISYAPPVTVNAEQKGKVSQINVKDGDWVNKGEIIAVLTNTDLTQELKTAKQNYADAKMSLSDSQSSLENAISNLEDRQEAAEDYIVTSPINGVILTKDYKTGDTVSGQNATTMMVVADMSKMIFTISVDELDISKIAVGQSVSVTADALEGERLVGKITTLSKLGTSSNGVTTYPVEVTIDEPGSLMPGMNVSAEIIVERADNTLMLPLEAVEYYGGKYYVTVVGKADIPDFGGRGAGGFSEKKGEGQAKPSEGTEKGTQRPAMPEDAEKGFARPNMNGTTEKGTERPNMGEASGKETENKDAAKTEPSNKDAAEKSENAQQSQRGSFGNGSGKMPSFEDLIKYSGKEERVEVTVGVSNDSYYEITSGVELGTAVKNTGRTASSSAQNRFGMGGMGGMGMPGGMGGMNRMPGGMGGMQRGR